MRSTAKLHFMLTITVLFSLPFVGSDNLAQQDVASDDKTPEQVAKQRLEDYQISERVLPKKARNILEHANELSVAAIEPSRLMPDKKSSEWIPVKDAEVKSRLLDALFDGIAHPDEPNRCFIPRHKVRAIANKELVELLICFECNQFAGTFSKDGDKEFGGPISHAPEEILTQLIAAGTSRKN